MMSPTSSRDETPAAALLAQATAFQLSQAIWVAAKLSVADHLRDGPMTVEKLAVLTGSAPAPLHRLLRAEFQAIGEPLQHL